MRFQTGINAVGDVKEVDRFADINKKETKKRVDYFLKHDYQQIRRFASYESIVSSTTINGQSSAKGRASPDNKFIRQATNKQLLEIINAAIECCSDEGSTIIKSFYANGDKAYTITATLNISPSTFSRKKDKALIELADALYFLTYSREDVETIDLRVPIK